MYDTELHSQINLVNGSVPELIPALSIKEILDFCSTPHSQENEIKEFFEHKKNLQEQQLAQQKRNFIHYATKKDIQNAIRQVNLEIDEYVHERRKGNPFAESHIEECLDKKARLQNRLKHFHLIKGKNTEEKDRAKEIPIDMFVEFNSSGFAKCLFHEEKTASMHLLPDKKAIWCFSCQKRKDIFDVIMKLHNVDFNEAIKIILKK